MNADAEFFCECGIGMGEEILKEGVRLRQRLTPQHGQTA
jgi:hypothetical protein